MTFTQIPSSTTSDRYIYIFVRQDLPLQHQIVQSNHATHHMSSFYRSDGDVPNIVLIGLPNIKALERALRKLRDNKIPHYAWVEPDNDFGLTSICTAPILGVQRDCLKNYRVYSPGAEQSACFLTEDRATKSTTSLITEHSVLT